MVHMRQYLLTVIAAAVICTIVRALTHNKGASAAIVNLITAVFLLITVISPWKNWSFSAITEHIKDYSDSAETIVNNGVAAAQTETAAIIKRQTEAYIVDKARSLGVYLQADVTISDTSMAQPEAVTITANTSPYLKQKISSYISTDLGIPEANQLWN